ncbi:hypothetical protein [Aeromonas popoffii]|uniref:hypothetical protein n=1 Tax=Aeromonas popoffii TaxID=70856 RepID=UPI0030D12448
MSIAIDVLRAHIMPGLTGIEAIPQLTYRGWIAKKSYRMSLPFKSKEFILDVYSHDEILLPYAFDINRMAASAFESIHGITPDNGLPKSTGWLVIRSYYSSYFAMQAILRIFGISCSQFDSNEAKAVTDVANIYSLQNGYTASTGYYVCTYDVLTSKAHCKHLNNTHQDVWKIFYELLEKLATKVSTSDFLKKDRDAVIQYLFKLREGLSHRNTLTSGSWLSKVRNEVNYTHSMGAWYPYQNSVNEHDKMFRITRSWNRVPTQDTIHSELSSCDQLLFVSTCVSIVSLCHALLSDIFKLNKDVYLKNGAMRLANQLDGV